MAWPGFFQFGGTEIINASRTEAYAQHLNAGWFKPVYKQPDLAWLLGEAAYATPLQDDAPWTDPDNLDSFDFMGVYPLDITGIESSTTSAEVVESVIDGGYVGKARHNTRAMVFTAALVGLSECSVEYGLRWLRSVLAGSPCFGKAYGVCGGADLCYLGCFPAVGEIDVPQVPGPMKVDGLNLAMNPGAESGVVDGWHSSDSAKWALTAPTTAPISGARSILSTRQAPAPTVVATNRAINPIGSGGGATGWWVGSRVSLSAGSGYLRATITDATATALSQRFNTPPTLGASDKLVVSPGDVVRARARVRSSSSLPIMIAVQFFDAAGAFLTSNNSTAVVTNASTFVDLPEQAGTAPANATWSIVQIGVSGTGPRTVGDTIDLQQVLITVNGTAGDTFFDGNTPAAGALTYRWTGTANASTSQRLSAAITDPTAASLYLTQSASGAYQLTSSAPVTAAMDVKVELDGRQVSGQLTWLDLNGTSISSTTAVTASPAAGAVTRLLLTGTPPVGAVFVRPVVTVTNPSGVSTAGERVWFDNLYVGADTSGAYFDGDTADTDQFTYQWTGDTNASTSQRLIQTYVDGPSPTPGDCYDKVGRSLHEVSCTTGPTVTAKMEMTDGGAAWTVTWTMVAANPAEFGVERPLIVGFLDPAVEIPYYGGVVPPGGTFDPDGHVQTEESCPTTIYNPVFDPLCALLVPPPDVPTIVPTCFSFPTSFTRRSFTIPRDNIPLWTEVVPLVSLTTGTAEARNVRLRFYADVFDTGTPDEDPCNFCGDVVFSYIPPGSTIVLDGMDQAVYVDQPGQGRRRADSLVSDSTGNPFEWPQFSCGFGYVVTVDTPQTTHNLPVVDLSLVPRTL